MPRLTDEQRERIRALYGKDGWTQEALATEFNVHVRTIQYTLNPQTAERMRARHKRRYQENAEFRERQKARNREWYAANREYRRAYDKEAYIARRNGRRV